MAIRVQNVLYVIYFSSKKCLKNLDIPVHQVGIHTLKLSACQSYFYCEKCNSICRQFHYIDMKGKKKLHNCEYVYCKVCKVKRKRVHLSFVPNKVEKKFFYSGNCYEKFEIYIFDFETESKPDHLGIFHPYFCAIYKFCNICLDDNE